ncbi:AAA family ATPase [Mumia qirimensis]|uniref:AAA family ATPase n=1 Tax=Mumia qirimensis TaxID=3234852 RepID=UPI00351D7D32
MTLRNFRGVEEGTVTFAPGVTVVVGPNESGKSSIAEAIRLLRTTKSSAKSQAVRNLQPVGRDVGPEAEIELETGPYALVYRKRWLSRPMTELEVRAPVPVQLSGDEAHQRFDAILAETVDVDLWNALEVIQGQALDQPSLAHISALQQALDDSAGATGDHDALMTAVDDEYARYFTPGGKQRGDYAESATKIAALEEQAAALHARSAEMDRYVAEHNVNEREFARLSTLEVETQARLAQAEKSVRALHTLREELTRAEDAVRVAESGHAQAVRDLAARRSLVDDLRTRADAVEDVQMRVDTAVRALAESGAAADDARVLAAAATERSTSARRTKDAVADALSRHRDGAERRVLAQRVRRARDASAAQTAARAESASILVDDLVLAELTDLATTCQVAEGARDAAATRLRIRAHGAHPVSVGDDLVGDDPYEATVLDEVRVTIDGVVDVVISPGTPPADLDGRVAEAREAFEAALRDAGVDSLATARASHERRRAAQARHDAAQTTLTEALDSTTLDELEVRLATLEQRLAAAESDGTASSGDELSDSEGSSRDALESAYDAAREAADEAEAAAEAARVAHDTARDLLAATGEAAVRARQELESAHDELDRATTRLAAARDGRPDAGLERAVAEADGARATVTAARDAARAAFEAASPATLAMELDNVRDLVVRVDAELDRAASRRVELKTLLDDRAAEGIHDRLADVEAALDRARSTHLRVHRSAQAVHLLRSTLRRHRDEAQRQYVAPFRERIDRMGQVVFGPDFQVSIGTDLSIESRTLAGRTVPFGSLSGGAREQLGVLGRLACAQLVAGDGGAPVILDDTMGFADPERLQQLAVVLNDVGRSAQVVLLTCQPSRFDSVGSARTARLVTA